MSTPRKPKIQGVRKFGHLWQVSYGTHIGSGYYGYGITRKLAGDKARAAYAKGEQR